MSQFNNRLLTITLVVILVTTLASNGAVRTVAQSVQQVFVTNTATNPVPVQVRNAVSARVTNPATAPVWVRDVDEARQPIVRQWGAVIGPEESSKEIELYTVPTDKRLVITYVSGQGFVPGDQGIMYVGFRANVGNVAPVQFVDLTWQGTYGNRSFFTTGEATQLYADPGTRVRWVFERTGSAGSAYWNMTITGYLVNVP